MPRRPQAWIGRLRLASAVTLREAPEIKLRVDHQGLAAVAVGGVQALLSSFIQFKVPATFGTGPAFLLFVIDPDQLMAELAEDDNLNLPAKARMWQTRPSGVGFPEARDGCGAVRRLQGARTS